ncbi:conserved hypothetical protein [Flavobacterium sp. 9AF]|uniref:hypothetical protein n=1 Tax=Flavobacterium sp. 9AF TaxID=2653142 RepID=UPI0012EFCB2E|nr:hypothetical protein [Flavobacterium sp. 9AF]VXB10830.1 conserved hypothetical protein [Flavobacterium sp. 9AF]
MEPNKLDTKIKEQLGSREIKPTDQAWDRLDAMLSLAEKKEPKKVFGIYKYIGIAASILLFLSVGFWLYQNEKSDVIEKHFNEGIVNEEKKVSPIKDSSTLILNTIKEFEIVEQVANHENLNQKESILKNNNLKTNSISSEKLVTKTPNQFEVINLEKDSPVTKAKNRYITAEKLLASIENRTFDDKEVNNKEVKKKIKVNTNTLLTDVESELDIEFRESRIDKITRKYNQVKSAIANRNYE